MLGSGRYMYFPDELRAGSLSPTDRGNRVSLSEQYERRLEEKLPREQLRKDKKNHTNKLQELALLIPVTVKTRNKKHTKKEILLRVLHYIQYLQRSIDVAKALLKLHSSHGRGLGRNPSTGPTRRRHSTPSSSPKSCLWGTCSRPRKKFTRVSGCPGTRSADQAGLKLTEIRLPLPLPPECHHCLASVSSFGGAGHTWGAERPTWPQKPRRSLALDQPENLVTAHPGQKEENGKGATCPRDLSPGTHPTTAPPLSEGDHGAGAQHGEPDIDVKAQSRAQRPYLLTRAQSCLRQKLLLCTPSERDKEASDTDPWLPAWTSEDSPHGSPLASGSSQTSTWHVTNYLSEILGLSSSLFSSPSKTLPDHILEDGSYFLTEGLLESSPADGELEGPQEKDTPSQGPSGPSDFQCSVSLDHSYLPLSENMGVLSSSSSSSESTDTDSLWGQETPSDEDRDYTWTPTRESSGLLAAGKKTKKAPASQGAVKPKANRAACPGQAKKKCVNGFIMFCRMNRKQYIRACPGTASTAATKELAQLWRGMTLQERRPYCTKARRFSRQHNRIVKRESSSSEDDDGQTPKPFYQLLAERAQASLGLASLPSPHCQ